MIFTQVPLTGVYIIDTEPKKDERGFFSRTVCRDEFANFGLNTNFVQQSVSWNLLKGTIRALHYQATPHAEDKLVRVTQGAIFDVVVDIRIESLTFGQWFSVELSAQNHCQLYIPKGFAHGFQTLQNETEIFYQMTVPYKAEAVRGIRWNDSKLRIVWPIHIESSNRTLISETDYQLPEFENSKGELK